MIPSSEIRELNLRDYADIVHKRRWLAFAIIATIVGVTIFYDIVFPKIYKATNTILIEKEIPKITERGDDIYLKEIRDAEYYQTQYNLLKSRSLAERVLNTLNLSKDPEFASTANPVRKLLSMLKIEPVRLSNIVNISVVGKDPLKITSIANTWAREFMHQDVEKKVGLAKYGVTWLESQLSDTLDNLQKAEKELNKFIRDNRIITIPDIESKKETLIEDLKSQKATVEKEIEQASKRYKGKHPQMISLNAQLSAIDRKMKEETEKLLNVQEVAVDYKLIKRRVDTYKSLYDDLLQRAKQLDVSKELTLTNIRVVDAAEVPKKPIRPSPKKDIPVALIASIFLSVAICFLLEYLDSTLKTSEDIELYTKLPFLGYIPSAKKEVKSQRDTDLVAQLKPHSRVVESFRNVRVSLIFSSPQDKPLRSLLITSSTAKEGKTFISSNLAIISAQAKEPTLLIDADMRKGRLSKSFDIKKEKGLSSILTGMCSLEEAIVSTPIPDLSLLGCGPYTPNPTELLGSERLKTILKEAQDKFARVVIDGTPLLAVADSLILGDICDGLVLVVRAGYTPLKYVSETKKKLGKKIKIIGAILNNTETEGDSYYHYYGVSPEEEDKKKKKKKKLDVVFLKQYSLLLERCKPLLERYKPLLKRFSKTKEKEGEVKGKEKKDK